MSIRRLAFAFLCALLAPPALAMIPPIEEPDEQLLPQRNARPAVRLSWVDNSNLVPGQFERVKKQTGAILGGVGIGVEWRVAAERELAGAEDVRVIFVSHAVFGPDGRPALGVAPVGPRVHRMVWVHVPQILAAVGVGSRLEVGRHSPRQFALADRALARVIVHELVHALAPEVRHGGGIMSACLTRALLTAEHLKLEPPAFTALRAALERQPVRSADGGGRLVARLADGAETKWSSVR